MIAKPSRARSWASPLIGEIAQALGVLIIVGVLTWQLLDHARLFGALLILGFAWFFFGRWLRHRNGIH